jgi:hypothetical protein
MSKVKIQGNASGTGVVTLTAPNTNTDRTITLPDGDITLGVGIDDNATSNAITIDASENVGIGTSSPTLPLDIVSNAGADALKIRARTNDDYGTMTFYNNAGTTKWADIQAKSTKDLIIYTNGGSERVRVLAGGGITFNGDTAAANALDDYEEGTWTPTFDYGTSITYTSQSGRYTKIGKVVHCTAKIVVSSKGSDGSGLQIGGLPYTGNNDEEAVNVTMGRWTNFLGSKTTAVRNWRFTGAVLMPMENNDNSVTYNEVATSGTLTLAFTYII